MARKPNTAWRAAAAAALLLVPPALAALCRLVGLQSLPALLRSEGWGWECLLLLGPALLLGGCFDRLWCVWLAEGVPLLLLTLVSFYKQIINGSPLEPGDFALFGTAGEVLGFALPQLRLTGPTAAALALFLSAAVSAFCLRRRLRPGGFLRLAAAVLGAGLTALLLLTSFAAAGAAEADGCGTPLRLYRAWKLDARSDLAPEDNEALLNALRSEVTDLRDAAEAAAPSGPEAAPITPTVIFLMSESFFDVSELPGVTFAADPLPCFHALAEESASGKFLSQTYCGGTGYVELEVLTGLCSALLRSTDTLTSLPVETYRALPCITDVFDDMGYRKYFLHAYNDRLYNRRVIYEAFGFDRVLFEDSFPEDAPRAGGYLSDMALSQEILSLLDDGEAAPKLIFAVSMENHQPYTAAKYGEPCRSGLSSDALTEVELEVLDAYVRGAEDADEALGRLVGELREREEPVMLVFWGDHLPNLGLPDGGKVFDRLGCCIGSDTEAWPPEELQRMLSTDYVIWTNYGTHAEDRTESSLLLGLHVLEKLGFPLTDYYSWLRERIEDACLMFRPRLFTDASGRAFASVPAEARPAMTAFAAAVGDIVYGGSGLFEPKRRQP